MIKNVIFDFGQVLVRFEPEYMVRQYVENENDVKLLSDVVFDRLYWDKLDLGTITDKETIELCRERLPKRLWDAAEKIHWNWIYNIPEIDGMKELIKYIKERYGTGVFVLSNISHYFADHSHEIDILNYADGCVFSARIGITKPDYRIFDYMCKKYNLDPKETVFVDDNENNIKSSIEFGLNGYIFDGDAKKLKSYLETVL
ncbi:MAG: HAD family phosphatase [Clostridia bacterium]|nr:HAD family phosphatase [Clostridia bacterium]